MTCFGLGAIEHLLIWIVTIAIIVVIFALLACVVPLR
jgi:hypothetical protein